MSTKRTTILVAAAAASILVGGCGIGDAQSQLRTAVDAQQPTLDQCYASALERSSDESGQMQVWLHVDKSSGTLKEVEVVDATVQDTQLKSCVEQALVGIQMDPPPKANLQVEYFIRFNPTS
jgi:hypothetical protein